MVGSGQVAHGNPLYPRGRRHVVDDRSFNPPKPSSSEDPTSPDSVRPTPVASTVGGGAALDPLIGCTLGGCVVIERVAEGGMGVVYKAVQSGTERVVAIKTIRPEGMSRARVDAFIREARLLANNPHDNLVVVYDAGIATEVLPESVPFLVMEFLPDARDIVHHANAKGWSKQQRIDAFLKVCDATQHLHSRGIVHFDIKPSNILVDARGRIRLTDLGLARTLAEAPPARPGGSHTHMSPEQLFGDPAALDNRCDVFALGVVLFELLTGRLPYAFPVTPSGRADAPAAHETMRAASPPSLTRIDSDLADLDPIVTRAIEPDRDRRYPAAEAMGEDLRGVLGKWGRAEAAGARRLRIPALLAALAIVVVATVVAQRASKAIFADWTPLEGWWGQRLTSVITPVALDAPLDNVAIVALTDDTDTAGLARRLGLDPNPADRRSLRPLHGELCRVLADSGARCIVFDIIFGSESDYDDAFAAGIDAAVAAGVPVVLGARNWSVDADGRPGVSPKLWRPGVEWGSIKVSEFDPTGAIWIPLIIGASDGTIYPSLAVSAYASARADGALRELAFDESGQGVEISFWQARHDRPDKRTAAAPTERIPLTLIDTFDQSAKWEGRLGNLRTGDRIGMYRPIQFDRAPLDGATHEFADVLEADPVKLRQWFADRVVVVGDMTNVSADFIPRPNDDPWPGPYLHAMAIESLMRNIHPRIPDPRAGILLAATASVFGVLVVFPWRRSGQGPRRATRIGRVALRLALLAAGIIVLFSFSMIAYDQLMLLWSPFKPILALILASLGALIIIPRLA